MNAMLPKLALAGLLVGPTLPALAQVTYTPVAVTGFTDDVVADGSGPAAGSTTASVDYGAPKINFVYMAPSYVSPVAGVPPRTLPASGKLQNPASPTTPGLVFQLQPYAGNNALRIAGTGTGRLTLAKPQATQSVWVAAAVGNGNDTGSNPITMTVEFADGSTQAFAEDVPDWFGGVNYIATNLARTNRDTDELDLTDDEPRIYQVELALDPDNYAKQVRRVGFDKVQPVGPLIPAVLNVLAVTLASTCTQSAAAINYPDASYCRSGSSGAPAVVPAGGTFSGPAGLVINANTGDINLAATAPGTYAITYTTTGLCATTATDTVLVKDDALPTFPNVVTPNGDGLNDELVLNFRYPADLTNYRLQVYSRWGRRLFDTHDPTAGWNPAESSGGLYYYLVDFTDCANRAQQQKTWVEVIK